MPAIHDLELGYVPRPSTHNKETAFGVPVTINEQGFRESGHLLLPDEPCILAVGDSFVFGCEVGDSETWPAQLEGRLARRVHNAGVIGYGLDQTVLYAERLVPKMRPRLLIVSFIADDIVRCTMSERYAPKPYFEIVEGKLDLRNVPVPRPRKRDDSRVGLKWILGWSQFADVVLTRATPHWWLETIEIKRVQRDSWGLDVAKLLVDRLSDLSHREGLPILMISQGQPWSNDVDLVQPVLKRARQNNIPVLDLLAEMDALIKADPSKRVEFYKNHMRPAGNAWVAERIATWIRQNDVPSNQTEDDL